MPARSTCIYTQTRSDYVAIVQMQGGCKMLSRHAGGLSRTGDVEAADVSVHAAGCRIRAGFVSKFAHHASVCTKLQGSTSSHSTRNDLRRKAEINGGVVPLCIASE